MHISQHADQRMNQRGIPRRLVEFTLRHGRVEGDRHVLDRNESRRIIETLTKGAEASAEQGSRAGRRSRVMRNRCELLGTLSRSFRLCVDRGSRVLPVDFELVIT